MICPGISLGSVLSDVIMNERNGIRWVGRISSSKSASASLRKRDRISPYCRVLIGWVVLFGVMRGGRNEIHRNGLISNYKHASASLVGECVYPYILTFLPDICLPGRVFGCYQAHGRRN